MLEESEITRVVQDFVAFLRKTKLVERSWHFDESQKITIQKFMAFAGFNPAKLLSRKPIAYPYIGQQDDCNPVGNICLKGEDEKILYPATKWLDEVLGLSEAHPKLLVSHLVKELKERLRDFVDIQLTTHKDSLILPRILRGIEESQFGQFPKLFDDLIGEYGKDFGTHDWCGGQFVRGVRNRHLDYISCSKGCGMLVLFPNTTRTYREFANYVSKDLELE